MGCSKIFSKSDANATKVTSFAVLRKQKHQRRHQRAFCHVSAAQVHLQGMNLMATGCVIYWSDSRMNFFEDLDAIQEFCFIMAA
jgi:hypothetical protein